MGWWRLLKLWWKTEYVTHELEELMAVSFVSCFGEMPLLPPFVNVWCMSCHCWNSFVNVDTWRLVAQLMHDDWLHSYLLAEGSRTLGIACQYHLRQNLPVVVPPGLGQSVQVVLRCIGSRIQTFFSYVQVWITLFCFYLCGLPWFVTADALTYKLVLSVQHGWN